MSNNWDGMNRRKVIKSIGVASGSLVSGGLGMGTAAANGTTPSEGDIEIVDTEIKHDISVSSLTGPSTTDETQISPDARIQQQKPKKVLKQLIDLMEQKSGLTAAKEKGPQKVKKKKETPYANVTVDFTTNDQNVNSYNPALDVIPFGADKRKNKGADQQGSGLLFIYTVVEDGHRVPVGVLGLTQTQTPEGDTSIRSYLIDEGEPVQANHISTTDDDSISTRGLWACSGCTTLVGGICDYGMVIVGQYACVGMCVAAFNANFVAAYGCASICSTMFSVIAAVGCAAGGTVICQEMTERTPDSINFC